VAYREKRREVALVWRRDRSEMFQRRSEQTRRQCARNAGFQPARDRRQWNSLLLRENLEDHGYRQMHPNRPAMQQMRFEPMLANGLQSMLVELRPRRRNHQQSIHPPVRIENELNYHRIGRFRDRRIRCDRRGHSVWRMLGARLHCDTWKECGYNQGEK
jgi:hypothetical protein